MRGGQKRRKEGQAIKPLLAFTVLKPGDVVVVELTLCLVALENWSMWPGQETLQEMSCSFFT